MSDQKLKQTTMMIKLLIFHVLLSSSLHVCFAAIVNRSTLHPTDVNCFRSSVYLSVSGNVYPLGYYYVTVEIGNAPKQFQLDIDTGSDLAWVQCDAPCVGCTLPEKNNYVLCMEPICVAVHSPNPPPCKNPTDKCSFQVEYANFQVPSSRMPSPYASSMVPLPVLVWPSVVDTVYITVALTLLLPPPESSDSAGELLWDQLRLMESIVGNEPWLLGGGFNVTLNSYESSAPVTAATIGDISDFQFFVDELVWFGTFVDLEVEFLAPRDSDHCPAFVWLFKSAPVTRPKPFKFFNFWTLHPRFMAIVEESCKRGKNSKKIQLANLDSGATGQDLKEGDQETKFFHSMVSSRRKSNTIRVLYDQNGTRLDTFEDMASEVVSEVSDLEIKDAIWGQGNDKSPVPDGYNPFFFKAAWPIVGEDFKNAIRGVRQGDPLSPYLFVLAINVLSSLLNLDAMNGIFQFHPRCKKIKLTHLCFVDDLLILCKGTIDSIADVQSVLDMLYSLSGLKLNANKCELFTAGIPSVQCDIIHEITGFRQGILPVRYLGVPLVTRKISINECQGLVDKIRARINTWANRYLSFAGLLIRKLLANDESLWVAWFLAYVIKNLDFWQMRSCVLKAPMSSGTGLFGFQGIYPSKTRSHMFFGYYFVKDLWGKILSLCGIVCDVSTWDGELAWAVQLLRWKSLIVQVMKLAFTSHMYCIWRERNTRLFGGRGRSVGELLNDIQEIIQIRFQRRSNSRADSRNVSLCTSWGILC
ncbi:Eukaryotic aspartyl protease family protein [Hibiscus syriacus]|uniref:Eukaryotic aspartyl protease family protein n=1 Tax=Hibiscus syriacus TaxID=106335 RepID=A0A6A2WI84_HIBSY|nr:Eukaryotic aspartyl protease family protein [Hibiscus syriacus]